MEPRSAAAHRSDNGGLAAPATWRERLRDMSREIPAFTGVYLDSSGNVAISIARDSIAGPDVTRIRAWAHQIAGLRTDGPTTLRRVKYNYATLYENLTTFQQSSLPRDPALNLIRIDEMAGKIVLGYSSTAAAERAKPDIADLGIPEDMVRFERTAAATPDTKLTQVFRPTRGGLRVASSTQFGVDPISWTSYSL